MIKPCAHLLIVLFPLWVLAQEPASPPAAPAESPVPLVTEVPPTPTVVPVDLESDFAVSVPKGLSGRVSFTAKVKNFDRIFVLDLEGRRVSPLVQGTSNNNSGIWSADGERLLFVSDRDGNKELYTVRWDGSEEVRLTTTPSLNEDQPAWHPNGKEVLYVADTAPGRGGVAGSAIFSLTISTGEVKQVTRFEGRNINPRWSPNGDTLVYATNRFWPGWRIALYKPGQGSEEYISKAEGQVVSQPIFSPDGERIYFASNTPGDKSIQMFKRDDRSLASVRQGEGRHIDPATSPDDKSVLFAYAEHGATAYSLFVVSRVDKSIQSLLSSVYSVRHPNWNGVKAIALEAAKVKAVEAAPAVTE